MSEQTDPVGALRGRRVLVVDDNRDAADSLGMMLRFAGADVHVEYDGLSALEAILDCKPNVVVLDIGMPRLNGCELARSIRSDPAHGGILLVALTGWGQAADRLRSHEAGIDHHLVKPVDFDVLQDLLLATSAPHAI
jgi:CheY-like chemotaxis protein